MADEPMQPMHPWYRGYTGQVVPTERGSYQCYGTLSKLDETTLHISELPLRKWTQVRARIRARVRGSWRRLGLRLGFASGLG